MRKVVATLGLFALSAHAVETANLTGYTQTDSTAEVQWEQKFRAIPETSRLRENMRRLAARPHHVGSPYDKDNAEWMLAQLKGYGLDAKIEQFDTLFPTPISRKLELLGEKKYVAKIEEPVLPGDPTTSQRSEQLPTYNAYSTDGDVTGPLVYVNYGAPADYEVLERMGVSVKGAIVIARYGETWRGIKPKVAAEHGAIGCLIYSDPHDDGYAQGDTYPNGPMRPADGAQRGSVMDMPIYPGDPQTPGIGAVPGAKKIPLKEVTTITKIPVMPISYDDATPFLKSLNGQVVPAAWRGSLPITYKTGPSVAKAHLALKFNWDRKPLYDVVMTIKGSEFPDEWIIRGNHHDGWVNGAEDPIAGASPQLEEARALGELLKQGWKPKRTIIYAWWDGEEPSLLGSTEWLETHAEDLAKHAVAYINSDGNSRGYFHAQGSHSLEAFVNGVTKDIEDPETKMSVWKREKLVDIAHASGADAKNEIRTRQDLRIGALGSGSDYTGFVDHLGIASINIGYGGEDLGGGQYHSIYDDFAWYSKYMDTDFVYGRALAQTGGTMMLRLADADVLPFKFTNSAETIAGYVKEIKKLVDTTVAQTKERNLEINEGVYDALADPRKKMVPPAALSTPPAIDLGPLETASANLMAAAAAYDKAFASADVAKSAAVNPKIAAAEQSFLDAKGLPNRVWFEHMIYAPGFYTGYGVKTLPAVRETIEQREWNLVDDGIARTAAAINRYADALKAATGSFVSN